MQDQEELIFRKDIFWEGLPWEEIYACGDHDREESVLPSRDRKYSNREFYPNSELLVTTTRKVLEETKKRLSDLEQKILGYQPERREELLKNAQQIADGTFNGRIEVEGNFSHDLGGDSHSRIEDIPGQLEDARKAYASKEYQDRIKKAELVAVEAGDTWRYTGLVMVAQGLGKMLSENIFIPEVIGKYFHDTYKSLMQ